MAGWLILLGLVTLAAFLWVLSRLSGATRPDHGDGERDSKSARSGQLPRNFRD
jgi:hypothetical protein